MTEIIKQNKWWEKINDVSENTICLNTSTAINSLLSESLNNNKIIFNESFSGKTKTIEQNTLISKITSELEVKEVLNWSANDILYTKYYVSDDSYLEINVRSTNYQFITNNKEKLEKFKNICKTYVEKTADKKGAVNVLVQGPNSLYLSAIGVGGVDLNKLNYNDIVIEQYNKIVCELKSKNPSGRIVIMNGSPGTGKSFIIRGLLNDCENVSFIFIPSYMVSNLTAPSLLPILAEEAENGKPIVLVIEDADSCLVRRQSDNFSDVSTLLNLGDGILGSILDIRIVCTTNAKQLDIDPALKRNGRLCALIEVDKLPPDKANNILKNLLGTDTPNLFTNETILADVYAKAREMGWNETK